MRERRFEKRPIVTPEIVKLQQDIDFTPDDMWLSDKLAAIALKSLTSTEREVYDLIRGEKGVLTSKIREDLEMGSSLGEILRRLANQFGMIKRIDSEPNGAGRPVCRWEAVI